MTDYLDSLANARRSRRYSATESTLATLASRPLAVQRTIDAAVYAACKVLTESGMPCYVGDGAGDLTAAIYQHVVRSAELEQITKVRAVAEKDARELAEILR